MTGSIGAAVVTAGPGLTNTITAVKNAQMAESPVLLMGGAAVTLLKVRKLLKYRILETEVELFKNQLQVAYVVLMTPKYTDHPVACVA